MMPWERFKLGRRLVSDYESESSESLLLQVATLAAVPSLNKSRRRIWRWEKQRSSRCPLTESSMQFLQDRTTAFHLSRVIYGQLIFLYSVLWSNIPILGD